MSTNNVQQQLNDIAIQKHHLVEMMFYPNAWISAQNWLASENKTCRWEAINFPPVPRSSIPKSPGVYIFVVVPNVFDFEHSSGLFYVGKATNLYSRISSYIGEIGKDLRETTRPHIWRMVNLWAGHLQYNYMVTSDVSEAEAIETEMLKAFRPYFNKQYDAETSQVMRAF